MYKLFVLHDVLTCENSFAEELGVFVPNEGQPPPEMFAIGGFGNPFDVAVDGATRDAAQMFWRGMARPSRRHGTGQYISSFVLHGS